MLRCEAVDSAIDLAPLLTTVIVDFIFKFKFQSTELENIIITDPVNNFCQFFDPYII